MFAKPLITARAGALVETPVALKHNDSVFCWCDPLVEVNDNGQEEVVHKEVTWN
jgi:predicted deacetylase